MILKKNEIHSSVWSTNNHWLHWCNIDGKWILAEFNWISLFWNVFLASVRCLHRINQNLTSYLSIIFLLCIYFITKKNIYLCLYNRKKVIKNFFWSIFDWRPYWRFFWIKSFIHKFQILYSRNGLIFGFFMLKSHENKYKLTKWI